MDKTKFPVVADLPEVSTTQMIEVDRLMVEFYHVSLVQMMENAGRCLAILARDQFLGGRVAGQRIAVLAGAGGNGGGALTAARRLANWGARVDVGLLRQSAKMTDVPHRQLQILRAATVLEEIEPKDLDQRYDLIIDGMIGYSLSGAPRGRARAFTEQAAALDCAKLSLDVPSGFDASTGTVSPGSFRADATLTLALPKFGLPAPANQGFVGTLYCADISVPPSLYTRLDPAIAISSPFVESDIVRVAVSARSPN